MDDLHKLQSGITETNVIHREQRRSSTKPNEIPSNNIDKESIKPDISDDSLLNKIINQVEEEIVENNITDITEVIGPGVTEPGVTEVIKPEIKEPAIKEPAIKEPAIKEQEINTSDNTGIFIPVVTRYEVTELDITDLTDNNEGIINDEKTSDTYVPSDTKNNEEITDTYVPSDTKNNQDPIPETTNYEEYTIKGLRAKLDEMGLSTSGNKTKLIERILSNKIKYS